MAGVSKPPCIGNWDEDASPERTRTSTPGCLSEGPGHSSTPAAAAATLDALIDFAANDPRMETGCLFLKQMRSGKTQLGPETPHSSRKSMPTPGRPPYATFPCTGCRDRGEWPGWPTVEAGALPLPTDRAGHHPAASGEDRHQPGVPEPCAIAVHSAEPRSLGPSCRGPPAVPLGPVWAPDPPPPILQPALPLDPAPAGRGQVLPPPLPWSPSHSPP